MIRATVSGAGFCSVKYRCQTSRGVPSSSLGSFAVLDAPTAFVVALLEFFVSSLEGWRSFGGAALFESRALNEAGEPVFCDELSCRDVFES